MRRSVVVLVAAVVVTVAVVLVAVVVPLAPSLRPQRLEVRMVHPIPGAADGDTQDQGGHQTHGLNGGEDELVFGGGAGHRDGEQHLCHERQRHWGLQLIE
jgi:hypothetical protein